MRSFSARWLEQATQKLGATVVDQDIYLAEGGHRLVQKALHVFGAAHVGLDSHRLATAAADAIDHLSGGRISETKRQ